MMTFIKNLGKNMRPDNDNGRRMLGGKNLVVFTLTGIPLAGGRFAVAYSTLMAAAWISHPAWALVSGQGLSPDLIAGYTLQAAIVAFGLMVVYDVRSQLGRSDARYSYLFSQAPVALWENDFSGASAWLDDLRTQGLGTAQGRFHARNHAARRRC